MKFNHLRPETWQEYLAAHQSFDGLWIFQHVPKTAGSSITAALGTHAAPYTNIVADRTSGQPLRKQYHDLVAKVPLTRGDRPLRSISGHLWKADVDLLIQRVPDARLFTFVRDPVERVISDFRYSRTPAHAHWERQIADFPDLDAYIEGSPAVRNKTVFFLTGQRSGDATDVVRSVLSRFDYIGLLEEMALSHGILARLLKMGEVPVEHRRSTEAVPENADQPTPAQLSRIRAMNDLDLALFDQVRSVYRSLDDSVLQDGAA